MQKIVKHSPHFSPCSAICYVLLYMCTCKCVSIPYRMGHGIRFDSFPFGLCITQKIEFRCVNNHGRVLSAIESINYIVYRSTFRHIHLHMQKIIIRRSPPRQLVFSAFHRHMCNVHFQSKSVRSNCMAVSMTNMRQQKKMYRSADLVTGAQATSCKLLIAGRWLFKIVGNFICAKPILCMVADVTDSHVRIAPIKASIGHVHRYTSGGFITPQTPKHTTKIKNTKISWFH